MTLVIQKCQVDSRCDAGRKHQFELNLVVTNTSDEKVRFVRSHIALLDAGNRCVGLASSRGWDPEKVFLEPNETQSLRSLSGEVHHDFLLQSAVQISVRTTLYARDIVDFGETQVPSLQQLVQRNGRCGGGAVIRDLVFSVFRHRQSIRDMHASFECNLPVVNTSELQLPQATVQIAVCDDEGAQLQWEELTEDIAPFSSHLFTAGMYVARSYAKMATVRATLLVYRPVAMLSATAPLPLLPREV